MRTSLLTAQTAKRIDRTAELKFGISTLVLMENAGARVAHQAIAMNPGRKKIACFCGKGNNGGDGFVACRHLLAQGIKPDVYLACAISEVRNEAKVNLDILRNLKQKIVSVTPETVSRINLQKYGCIIDALLGVGLSGPVSGIYGDIIALMNVSNVKVLSVDIPSGLDATTGKVLGACVKADTTVTFVGAKVGMVTQEGRAHCGRIITADLGLPL